MFLLEYIKIKLRRKIKLFFLKSINETLYLSMTFSTTSLLFRCFFSPPLSLKLSMVNLATLVMFLTP